MGGVPRGGASGAREKDDGRRETSRCDWGRRYQFQKGNDCARHGHKGRYSRVISAGCILMRDGGTRGQSCASGKPLCPRLATIRITKRAESGRVSNRYPTLGIRDRSGAVRLGEAIT
ncbi:13033_t:CDS:2 [Acaulospora colombiana]|uniref:13033_t:CDS:1 n=1 Tax=Acaulospora colombiana TaxID=27376 RepID=A0ACA9PGC3_9GLOM|nr:13033_t:CDS:2 [Acaulospora colombiana]